MMIRTSALVAAGILAVATPAQAVTIYFNGVRVNGLKNQQFKNCKVRFDAQGNVHITAKGYAVKQVPKGGSGTSGSSGGSGGSVVNKRYFLVLTGKDVKKVQYDVDVYVNGKWVKKFRSSEPQVVYDVSKKLRQGVNVIHFAATKNYRGQPRASSSKGTYMRIILGTGHKGGGTVNITQPYIDYRVSAAKTGNFGKEYKITVK